MMSPTIVSRLFPRMLTVALALAGVSAPAMAQTDDPQAGRLRLPDITETSAWSWLETRRDTVSRNVSGIGRGLDDWLAGDSVGGERSNESYLRVKLNQQVSENGDYHSTARISGRIDLPRATERWKLIFESEQSETDSLRDQRLSNIRPSEVSGGFSYELPERNGLRFAHDLGVKGRIPLDPFYRFRTRYGLDLNETWYFGADHKLWYYHTDGWGQDARIYFSRPLTETTFLRIDTEVDYKDRYNQFEYAQTVSVHQSLGERETLTYEAGVIGASQPNPRVENYYLQTVYRKAIYEDWLVMELVPQLIMARDESWDPEPRFQFNLEVYFFDF